MFHILKQPSLFHAIFPLSMLNAPLANSLLAPAFAVAVLSVNPFPAANN